MTSDVLSALHDHYRDTCASLTEYRERRDRYFYLVLAVLALAWLDVATPDGFAAALGDVIRSQLGVTESPDLAYVRTLLWFLLLGLTLRYGQAALGVERLYGYLHEIEARLAREVPGGFRREGDAYRRYQPLFLSWAHYLYSLVFPLLLAAVTSVWAWRQVPAWSWPFGDAGWPPLVWLNLAVTGALVSTIVMFLHAFHFYGRSLPQPPSPRADGPKSTANAPLATENRGENQPAFSIPDDRASAEGEQAP